MKYFTVSNQMLQQAKRGALESIREEMLDCSSAMQLSDAARDALRLGLLEQAQELAALAVKRGEEEYAADMAWRAMTEEQRQAQIAKWERGEE